MARILITGGSSYLGQHLVPLATQSHQVGYTFYQNDPLLLKTPQASENLRGLAIANWQIDLRDGPAVQRLVDEWRPEVIIHLAGSNRSPDMAAVITQGTSHIVRAAEATNARLIHLSSDVVFDGRHAPYRELDSPSPIHDYGRAKAEAETIVARYPNHVIVRTSLIYGRRIMDRSTEWIAASLSQGRPVTLFDNQWRNPVWARTLSLACLELAENDFCGILHVAGRRSMSRAEFGLKLLDWWGIDGRQSLKIGPSGEEWPLDCRLDISLAAGLLKTPLLGVDEVLARPAGGELTTLEHDAG